MTVENATVIIGLGAIIVYYILYKTSKLTGSLAMMGLGVLTFYYSRTGLADETAYGVFAIIIFMTGILLLVNYLVQPIGRK